MPQPDLLAVPAFTIVDVGELLHDSVSTLAAWDGESVALNVLDAAIVCADNEDSKPKVTQQRMLETRQHSQFD